MSCIDENGLVPEREAYRLLTILGDASHRLKGREPMKKYIVMSPCYEILRFGHDKIKKQTTDAHTAGKFSKLVIGQSDLIDRSLAPTSDNFRFESCQADHADIVIYVDQHRESFILKGADLCEETHD